MTRCAWRHTLAAALLFVVVGVAPTVHAQQNSDRLIQAFSLAMKANDFSFLARMDRLGLGPATRDPLGNNLIMIGIREGGEQMVLLMLDDPQWRSQEVANHENRLGESALMLAALNGQEQIVRRLIALGAEVNRPGWTALHYAATSGHVSVIDLLIEHHAYIDAESPNGTTPLMMAARFNHTEAARRLVRAGADVLMVNEAGLRARDYALEANNKDLEFFLNMEQIAIENRNLESWVNSDSSLSLETLVIESGGSVAVEGGAKPGAKEATAGEGTEVFDGIR